MHRQQLANNHQALPSPPQSPQPAKSPSLTTKQPPVTDQQHGLELDINLANSLHTDLEVTNPIDESNYAVTEL